MNAILWILLCLFAAAGVTQCVAWLVCLRKRPRTLRKGYHVIPMYDSPDELEAQLRYALSQIRWGGGNGEIVVLADMGLSEESLAICEEIRSQGGFLYCRIEQLADTIQGLDQLQRV